MEKQLAETGQAVTRLTLAQMRMEENFGTQSETSDDASDVSEDLKQFQAPKHFKYQDQEDTTKIILPKQHVPNVFYPKFNGDDPVVWKDKCVDYFLLMDLEPKHWVRMAAVHLREQLRNGFRCTGRSSRIPLGCNLSGQ
jgi:hypothetical protein